MTKGTIKILQDNGYIVRKSATNSNQENGISNTDKGKVNFQDFNSLRDEETNK